MSTAHPFVAARHQPVAVRRALEFVQAVSRTDLMAPGEDGAAEAHNRHVEEARSIRAALGQETGAD